LGVLFAVVPAGLDHAAPKDRMFKRSLVGVYHRVNQVSLTVTWPNSTSARIPAPNPKLMTWALPRFLYRAPRQSGSPIERLIDPPTIGRKTMSFIGWRKARAYWSDFSLTRLAV
jgi:hypothetical protein